MGVIVVILALSVGCKQAQGGPEEAAQSYLYALAERDAERIYPMLTPETRTRLARLHDMLGQTLALVRKHYPASRRAKAIQSLGLDVLDRAKKPEALFVTFMSRAGEPAALNRLQKLGTRTKEAVEGPEGTAVMTWGGDNIHLVQVGDRWYVALAASDESRLEKLEAMAERNLVKVRSEVEGVSKLRFGVSR